MLQIRELLNVKLDFCDQYKNCNNSNKNNLYYVVGATGKNRKLINKMNLYAKKNKI